MSDRAILVNAECRLRLIRVGVDEHRAYAFVGEPATDQPSVSEHGDVASKAACPEAPLLQGAHPAQVQAGLSRSHFRSVPESSDRCTKTGALGTLRLSRGHLERGARSWARLLTDARLTLATMRQGPPRQRCGR